MVSHLFLYQLTLIALVWLCVMLQWVWPSDSAAACPTPLAPPLHGPSASVSPNPSRASLENLIATPVSTAVTFAYSHPPPRHHALS
jgi:hypothetical protein